MSVIITPEKGNLTFHLTVNQETVKHREYGKTQVVFCPERAKHWLLSLALTTQEALRTQLKFWTSELDLTKEKRSREHSRWSLKAVVAEVASIVPVAPNPEVAAEL